MKFVDDDDDDDDDDEITQSINECSCKRPLSVILIIMNDYD